MSWLDKLMQGHGVRHETAQEDALTTYKQKLKGIVYDDELVEELAPVFAKLHGSEGFDKVLELIETKEAQICAISGGDWHEQQTDDQHTENKESDADENQTETLSADEILAKKYATE